VDLWKEAYNRAVYIFGSPLSPEKRRELRLTLSSIKDLHFRSVTAEPFPS